MASPAYAAPPWAASATSTPKNTSDDCNDLVPAAAPSPSRAHRWRLPPPLLLLLLLLLAENVSMTLMAEVGCGPQQDALDAACVPESPAKAGVHNQRRACLTVRAFSVQRREQRVPSLKK